MAGEERNSQCRCCCEPTQPHVPGAISVVGEQKGSGCKQETDENALRHAPGVIRGADRQEWWRECKDPREGAEADRDHPHDELDRVLIDLLTVRWVGRCVTSPPGARHETPQLRTKEISYECRIISHRNGPLR